MSSIRSNTDLSGTIVNGVLLGEPAMDPDTGEFMWDHENIPQADISMPPPAPDDDVLIAMLSVDTLVP